MSLPSTRFVGTKSAPIAPSATNVGKKRVPVKKDAVKSRASADQRIAKTLASNPLPMLEVKTLQVGTSCGDCGEKFESVVVGVVILLEASYSCRSSGGNLLRVRITLE